MTKDHTKIGNILAMSFFVKAIEILIIISTCSYFFAMLFQLLLEIQSDVMKWDEFAPPGTNISEEPEHFITFYNLGYDQ
jgi:hypothetical protein